MFAYCFFAVSLARDTTLTELSAVVVYLRGKSVAGSGLLISDDGRPYLVAAGHLSASLNSSDLIVARGDDDTPVELTLERLAGANAKTWLVHAEADIAALALNPTREVLESLRGHFFPLDRLVQKESAPKRERHLVVMGCPLNLGVTGRFSPISRRSHSASGLVRFNRFDRETEATFFLLEDPSVDGFSGGPVFKMSWPYAEGPTLQFIPDGRDDARALCVGIVHGTVTDGTGGKFAAITPTSFVVQLIKQSRPK